MGRGLTPYFLDPIYLVVYFKRPFGGPEYVAHYLGRYTHRVAICNHHLVSFRDGQITFRWRDSAHHNEQKLLTLSLDEFLRRFLLHILPKVLCASVISASWPTANVPSCSTLLSLVRRHTTAASRITRLRHQKLLAILALPQMRWTDAQPGTLLALKPSSVRTLHSIRVT